MQETNGFTIIELLLATAVFSLVLLGALAGFLRTGNLFYKGVSLTQTQALAKQIVDDVSANISNSNGATCFVAQPAPQCAVSTNGYNYYCIGNTRYTYRLSPASHQTYDSNAVPDLSPTGNFGLLKTTGISGCPSPQGDLATGSTTEMLTDNMRLAQFDITGAGDNLYNVNLVLAYGSDTSLQNPYSISPACAGSTQNQQFCSVSTLATSVYAGLAL